MTDTSSRPTLLTPSTRIYVAGHRGMVGSAIIRRLQAEGFGTIITRTHAELDLIDQQAVRNFFKKEAIDYVVLAAAKVGGINANNSQPADFIYQNMMIEANLIHEAWRAGVQRLLFLGSSCIYPKVTPQPMREEYLLNGPLEATNEPYAIAKIAGIKLCESYNRQHGTRYRSVMPTNLYGPNDNFDLTNSHVLPALIRKFHEAKISQEPEVEVWGSGRPRREFLHVDDMAAASVFVMGLDDETFDAHVPMRLSHINVGSGQDLTIGEAADLVREVVGYGGQTRFNPQMPDGTMEKRLDVSLLARLGWQASISLVDGLRDTYDWYLRHLAQ